MNYRMVSIMPIDKLSRREDVASRLDDLFKQDRNHNTVFHEALQDAIRLIGIEKIADNSDVTKQGIYYALRQNRLPRLLTISRILKSMGLRLAIVVDE